MQTSVSQAFQKWHWNLLDTSFIFKLNTFYHILIYFTYRNLEQGFYSFLLFGDIETFSEIQGFLKQNIMEGLLGDLRMRIVGNKDKEIKYNYTNCTITGLIQTLSYIHFQYIKTYSSRVRLYGQKTWLKWGTMELLVGSWWDNINCIYYNVNTSTI